MVCITQIPSQAKEVAGKFQNESLHFLAGKAANLSGKFLDDLERQFLCGHMLEELFDLLKLLFRNESLAELLRMQRRAAKREIGSDFFGHHTGVLKIQLG